MGSTVGDVGITPFGVQSFGVSDQYGALTLETLPHIVPAFMLLFVFHEVLHNHGSIQFKASALYPEALATSGKPHIAFFHRLSRLVSLGKGKMGICPAPHKRSPFTRAKTEKRVATSSTPCLRMAPNFSARRSPLCRWTSQTKP